MYFINTLSNELIIFKMPWKGVPGISYPFGADIDYQLSIDQYISSSC